MRLKVCVHTIFSKCLATIPTEQHWHDRTCDQVALHLAPTVLYLRSIALWLLLLPMALTVVPRGLLHDCVHGTLDEVHADAHHQEGAADCAGHGGDTSPSGQQTTVQADCPICDVHVLVALPGVVLTEGTPTSQGLLLAVTTEVRLFHAEHLVPSDRGPPVLS